MKNQDLFISIKSENECIPQLDLKPKQTENEKISLLEKQIQKKLDESKENLNYSIKDEHKEKGHESIEINGGVHKDYETNQSGSSLLGLDEDILQEEIEWVREMKMQSNFTTEKNGPDAKVLSLNQEISLGEFYRTPEEEETRKIDDLAKKVEAMITLEKNKERERIKQKREEDERELMTRIEEEMKVAEEMRILREEGKFLNEYFYIQFILDVSREKS